MTTGHHEAARTNAWGEWVELSAWPIRLRWWAAPVLILVVLAAHAAGAVLPLWAFLLVAVFVLVANGWAYRSVTRRRDLLLASPAEQDRLVLRQAGMDGAVLWALTYLSGGVTSPLAAAFLLPVFGAAVLLNRRAAFGLAGALAAGLALMALGEGAGLLPHQSLRVAGADLVPAPHPWQALAAVALLGVALFTAAGLAASVLRTFRRQMQETDRLREKDALLARRLESVFSILETIGSVRDLRQVLETAVSEVALVMGVKGASVKLLSEDGRQLRYAAAFGLPDSMVREQVVEVERSPLNKRIIQGESYITGRVTEPDLFQFGETLSAADIRSVLFVPLHLEGRVTGILGAYCQKADRFSEEEVNFFRLAAGLVAIALENARAYEAVTQLSRERAWFTMKVAHNLRAPLAGMLSILEVVRDGYLGPVTPEQGEYLRRLDRRARTMLSLVNGLMTLSRNRQSREAEAEAVTDPAVLAGRVQRTFQDKAAEKRITFSVDVPPDLPAVRGRLETLEQVLENLVSNAIKYTPEEGTVEIRLARADGTVRVEVSDTGIGVPEADRTKLFTEFFRAGNAKALEESGTGLGLVIVKEILDGLGGRVFMASEEKVGSIFVVHLPVAPETRRQAHEREPDHNG
jgi:signal transduction histidine kinase